MIDIKQPSFFYDQQRGYEKEIFIDYFLSWTLRCAKDGIEEEKNSNINQIVQQYSKYVLLTLLRIYDKENFKGFKGLTLDNTTIKRVETEKQWEQIDLFCKVHFEFDNKTFKCILIFENKMYSPLKRHQLPKYNIAVKNHCDKEYKTYDIMKLFIHSYPNFKIGKNDLYGFIPIHIDEISGAFKKEYPEGKRTGNALFDEFWYNYI